MASTETCCAPIVEHEDAAGGHFNTFPVHRLSDYRDALLAAYRQTRGVTETLAKPLTPEQQCIQSMPDASPVKWHRAHTSWFFETFLLQAFENNFSWHDPDYCYLFNSYYNAIGKQYPRAERGRMIKPDAGEITQYRRMVDERMAGLLSSVSEQDFAEIAPLLLLGLNHEQQHQELICTDFQHAWCSDPRSSAPWTATNTLHAPEKMHWITVEGGLVRTGYSGTGFSFDNERPNHKYWLDAFELANRPVLNGEYLEFVSDGGYEIPLLWLADGWAWVQREKIGQPLYWRREDGQWLQISCFGLQSLDPQQPVSNISFYEASAYANWSNARLPTEHEWEHAMRTAGAGEIFPPMEQPQDGGIWPGNTWEWTASPYVAYPRFQPGTGAVGEYNGKFMSNQMVLRGYSRFTAVGHSRVSYRNFFYPDARWQQSGLRLARDSQA